MNFFGHAVVASWRRSAAPFVLGAMLPDFATMCGARLAGADDAIITDGIAHHHVTDAAFHRLRRFRDLCRDTERALLARGVARGPARGGAHVGVELLLDGALLDDPVAAPAYAHAIERAAAGELADRIRWRDAAGHGRFRTLCDRLRERGLPVGYRDPQVVADLLGRILGHRPLLAPSERDLRLIAAELERTRAAVVAATPALLGELRRALPHE